MWIMFLLSYPMISLSLKITLNDSTGQTILQFFWVCKFRYSKHSLPSLPKILLRSNFLLFIFTRLLEIIKWFFKLNSVFQRMWSFVDDTKRLKGLIRRLQDQLYLSYQSTKLTLHFFLIYIKITFLEQNKIKMLETILLSKNLRKN